MKGNSVSEAQQDREMTVIEHLEELRKRLIISIVATVIGMIIAAMWLTWPVYFLLTEPSGLQLHATRPGEMFFAYFKVALVVGAALAMPVIVYQVMRFVMPALHPHEKRYLLMSIPAVTIAFITGLAFGLFVVIPAAVRYLIAFGGDVVVAIWTVEEYLSFVTTLLFGIGVSFETPIIIFFLARLGAVSAKQLASYRKFALIGAFVIAAIITPTPDPLNQAIVAIPIYLLYELGVLLARLGPRPSSKAVVP
jgi:sec-independent protein translocase protein TatC